MRDILIKILEAIQALAPSDDEEPAAESNVADTRATETEEPEEVPVKKTLKRSVK